MYNEDIKKDFIESISNSGTRIVAKSFLKRFDEVCESKFSKYFIDMSREEILEVLCSMGHFTITALRTDLYLLGKFAEWYNKNIHEINVNKVSSISVRDIDVSGSIRNALIEDEDELLRRIAPEFASDGYLEVPVMILSWCGLTIDEITNLRNEDVMFRDGCVFVQVGKTILKIGSSRLVDVLQDYKSVKSSIRIHRGEWTVYPDDLGYFIKNMVVKESKFVGKTLTSSRIRKRMEQYNRCVVNGDRPLTIDNTLLSGRLHRILESEISNGVVLPEVVANELRIKLNMVNDWIPVYEAYKRAFNIKIENKAD